MDRLNGKTALVTGAGNGIGRACAVAFAAEGASVVVSDVVLDAAEQTVRLIADAGGSAVAIASDAASADDNDAAVATAVETFGGIDILLTAAGISHAAYHSGDIDTEKRVLLGAGGEVDRATRFVETTAEEWHRVLDVNLTGTLFAIQAATRAMMAQGRGGAIITISSIAAKHPDAGRLAYGVSKAGVWMLTKHAASCLGPHGIRVNSIGPGLIDTNMLAVVDEVPGMRDGMLRAVPMGRFGEPTEVAAAAVFLASDEASYVTGDIIHPSGGYYVG